MPYELLQPAATRAAFVLRDDLPIEPVAAFGTWRCWPQLGVVHWEQWGDTFLFPKEGDLLLVHWLLCVQPIDRRQLIKELKGAMLPDARTLLRFRAVGRDGRERWIEGHATATVDPTGSTCLTAWFGEGADSQAAEP